MLDLKRSYDWSFWVAAERVFHNCTPLYSGYVLNFSELGRGRANLICSFALVTVSVVVWGYLCGSSDLLYIRQSNCLSARCAIGARCALICKSSSCMVWVLLKIIFKARFCSLCSFLVCILDIRLFVTFPYSISGSMAVL